MSAIPTPPFVPSQRETSYPGAGAFPGTTKLGWDNAPVNVYSREMTDFVPGDNSMANQPQGSVVSQFYFEHANLPLPKPGTLTPDEFVDDKTGRMVPAKIEEYSPGIVANKYEFVFLQRRRPNNATKNNPRAPQQLVITRGSRPQFPMFRPAITLPALNRHLAHGNKLGWKWSDIERLTQELIFLGGVDSLGPGESMNPDRVKKNYVVVFKHKFIAWNVWPELELPYRDLYFVLLAKLHDKRDGHYSLSMRPKAFESQTEFQMWKTSLHADAYETAKGYRLGTKSRTDMEKCPFVVESYYVGRSGPHEQGGVGEYVSKVIETYVEGKPVDLSMIPKHEIYLLNH